MQNRSESQNNFDVQKSSVVAAAFCGVCVNFLEVTKTRIISDSVNCRPQHFASKSLIRRMFQVPKKRQKIPCRPGCLPSTNQFEVMWHIGRNEGVATFFRGISGQVLFQMIRSGTFYPLYTCFTPYVKKHVTNNSILLPAVTSAFARMIAVTLTYSIEKWTTQIQNTKLNQEVNKSASMFSGFWAMAKRDLAYSAIAQTLLENTRNSLQEKKIVESEVGLTVLASVISGNIAAQQTYPYELIKTLRIIEYEKFKNKSNFKMLHQIYSDKGLSALTSGQNTRLIRISLGTCTFFGGLELQLQHKLKNRL